MRSKVSSFTYWQKKEIIHQERNPIPGYGLKTLQEFCIRAEMNATRREGVILSC